MNAAPTAPDAVAARAAIERFNDAFNRHDLAAVVAAMTDDVVFEGTLPPDGDRYEGPAVGAYFERLFAAVRERHFVAEEVITVGDRVVVRWLHRWVDADGTAGHVRGIDLFRVRDGKVAEKLSYVKG